MFRVPHEDPSGNTVILAPSKYSRILKATEFKSRNEGIKTREEAQAAKEQRTVGNYTYTAIVLYFVYIKSDLV